MQNLTQNELDQITKMQNQLQDDLSESQKWEELKTTKKCQKKS